MALAISGLISYMKDHYPDYGSSYMKTYYPDYYISGVWEFQEQLRVLCVNLESDIKGDPAVIVDFITSIQDNAELPEPFIRMMGRLMNDGCKKQSIEFLETILTWPYGAYDKIPKRVLSLPQIGLGGMLVLKSDNNNVVKRSAITITVERQTIEHQAIYATVHGYTKAFWNLAKARLQYLIPGLTMPLSAYNETDHMYDTIQIAKIGNLKTSEVHEFIKNSFCPKHDIELELFGFSHGIELGNSKHGVHLIAEFTSDRFTRLIADLNKKFGTAVKCEPLFMIVAAHSHQHIAE